MRVTMTSAAAHDGRVNEDFTGATPTAAVLVGLAAAACAIGLAILEVQWWVPTQIDQATAIEPPGVARIAVATGIVAATATALAGSIIPAIVAARLDVAAALRD